MNDIAKYIEEFVKKEYEINLARYNQKIDDSTYEEMAKVLENFFHSATVKKYRRTGREFSSEMHILSSQRNSERHVVRTVFQVKSYKDFLLGSSLSENVIGDLMYTADTSYDQQSKRPLYYANKYYLAETNEGLKIVYYKVYEIDPPIWVDSHDFEPEKVLRDGTLIDVFKISPPEYEPSLKDYLEN